MAKVMDVRGLTASEKHRVEKASLDELAVMAAFVELKLARMIDMERMYVAFDHIGPPDVGSHVEINGGEGKKIVAISDAFKFLKLDSIRSGFLDSVFTVPAKLQSDFSQFQKDALLRKEEAKAKRAGKMYKRRDEDQYNVKLRRQTMTAVPTVTYAQFCMAVWLLTHYEISTLAFNMYDVDGSGTLDIDEVKTIVKKIYSSTSEGADQGDPLDEKSMQVLDGMDVDGNGDVSRPEFVAMIRNYHYLMMPAFVLQRSVRENIFGMFLDWEGIEEERRKQDHITLVDIVKKIDETIKEQDSFFAKDGGAAFRKALTEMEGENFSVSDVKDGHVQITLETDVKTGVVDAAGYKDVKATLKGGGKEAKHINEKHRQHRQLEHEDSGVDTQQTPSSRLQP